MPKPNAPMSVHSTILRTVSPLVSVVVPVFNGMPYLQELVASLLDQNYPELEFVFSDGASTDGSVEYLLSLKDSRVRLVQQPPNAGAAANWTAATMEAHGEFTKLICQDDLLFPHAITDQVHDLHDQPEAVMAIARRDIVDASGRTLYANRGLSGLRNIDRSVVDGSELLHTCFLQGTNIMGEPLAVLFRTEALKAAMPWQDSNPLMLDLSTYQKVAAGKLVAVRRTSVGAFRVSATSWSTVLASRQLEQTRTWQRQYEQSQLGEITTMDRIRATVGRYRQTTLRRIAYTLLRARGALHHHGAS